MLGQLVIDKSSKKLSAFLYALCIVGNAQENKITRSAFEIEMSVYLQLNTLNRGNYNKAKLAIYFGFLDRIKTDNVEYLVLTNRGKKALLYIVHKTENGNIYEIAENHKESFLDLLFESILFDVFGKNNQGVERSKTDIEPPKVLMKATKDLDHINAPEIVYILYGMNFGILQSYEAAIASVSEKRNTSCDYNEIFQEWADNQYPNVRNIASDFKLSGFLANAGLLEETNGIFTLSEYSKRHIYEIDKMSPFYAPLQIITYADSIDFATEYIQTVILGRYSCDENIFFITEDMLLEDIIGEKGQNGEPFCPGVLVKAIDYAYRNIDTNVYVVFENFSLKKFDNYIGEFAELFIRCIDMSSENNGQSQNSINNAEIYSYLTNNNLAKRFLQYGEVRFPANLNIVLTSKDCEEVKEMVNEDKIDFVFKKAWVKNADDSLTVSKQDTESIEDYSLDDFLAEVYMSNDEAQDLCAILERKKNILLEGPPGVGKTFIAERLAFCMLGKRDKSKIKFVQFHQSYSYEDFVEGYKPGEGNSFVLRSGVFFDFCKEAEEKGAEKYFFIIDEINRGNVSKIFGELFMLIEADKREKNVTLNYSGKTFSVPKNMYIIAMMNTADRSLATIDFALRRRFAHYKILPALDNVNFQTYLDSVGCQELNNLCRVIKDVNNVIRADNTLGEDFCIGHSYLSNLNRDNCNKDAIRRIVKFDILPLLQEYWFDNLEQYKAQEAKFDEFINAL